MAPKAGGEQGIFSVEGSQQMPKKHDYPSTFPPLVSFNPRRLYSHKVSYGVEYTEEIRGHGPIEYNTQKWPVVRNVHHCACMQCAVNSIFAVVGKAKQNKYFVYNSPFFIISFGL